MTTTISPRHMKRRPGMAATLRPVLTSRSTVALGGAVITAASVGGVALAGPAMAAPASTNVVYLKAGSTGSLVKVVQQRLGGLAVDGVFGARTTTAVKALQGRKGLVKDGIVGPVTWAALGGFPGGTAGPTPAPPPTCSVKVLRYGSSGSLVTALQKRVGVSADGQFGPITLGAVKSFQTRKGVTADGRGIVGAATWRALGGMPCGVNPTPPAGGGGGSSSSTAAKVAQVPGIAKQFLGVPYLYGGSSPRGFDCSGLTQYSYSHAGLNIPRTAAQQQAYMKKTTAPVAGDLVFFGAPAYHVGIYLSPGMMLASPVPGQFVRIESIWTTPTNYGTLR